MKMSKRIWWAGAAVLVMIAGGLYYYYARPPAASWREARVTRGDIEVTVVSTGVVRPQNRLEIKPPIPGRMDQVLVQEGQDVRKGDILAWMSSTERAALMDAARARGPEELKRWEEMYRATPVLAPIHGTIIARNVEPGQTVTAQDAVLVMSDRLTVKAQVDETDIAQIRLGQKAVIVLDAYADKPIAASVAAIAYDAKTVSNVTTYEIDVVPQKVQPFLRSGMTANVTFSVATRREIPLLPSAAVRQRDGRAYVLVPTSEEKAPREKTIEIGLSDGKRTEVVSGLEEGAVVLVADVRLNSGGTGGSSPLVGFRRPKSSSESGSGAGRQNSR